MTDFGVVPEPANDTGLPLSRERRLLSSFRTSEGGVILANPPSFRTSERQRAQIRNPASFSSENDTQEIAPESYDLPPFAEVVAALADIDEATDVEDGTMDVEEIRLGLAIELEVRDGDGDAVRVTGSTPTQMTETTVMPVFHRLTVRITRESDA